MDALLHFLIGILTRGIGPLAAHNDPSLYPWCMGAVILCVLLALACVSTRKGAVLWYLPVQLGAILCGWLAFSTPANQLFAFAPTGFLATLAAAIHGVLAMVAVTTLSLTWHRQVFTLLVKSPLVPATQLITTVGLVIACELQRRLFLAVALTEVLLVYVSALDIVDVIFGRKVVTDKQFPSTKYPGAFASFYLAILVGALAIVLTHPIEIAFFNLLGLYSAFVCLDAVVMGWAGTTHYARYRLTAPAVLLVGLLGAAHVFAPITRNPGLTNTIWLESTVASAAFLIFAPHIDWVQDDIRQRMDKRSAWEKFVDWIKDNPRIRLAQTIGKELNGITALFFFGALILYHYLIHSLATIPGQLPIIHTTFAALIALGLNRLVVAAAKYGRALGTVKDVVFNDHLFDGVRSVSGQLLTFIIAVYAVSGNVGVVCAQNGSTDPADSSCFSLSATASAARGAPGSALTLLTNGHFWYGTIQVIAAAMLVLLAAGQLRYLYTVWLARQEAQPTR